MADLLATTKGPPSHQGKSGRWRVVSRKWTALLIALGVILAAVVVVHTALTARYPHLPGEPAGIYARYLGTPPFEAEWVHCPKSDHLVIPPIGHEIGPTCP